jgi:LysR family transcriptional regulator, transcriptional activator for bauABCD operon
VRIPAIHGLEYNPRFYLTINEKNDLSYATKALVTAILDAHDVNANFE